MIANAEVQHARHWIARWDVQQERYIERREERFEAIGDVLAQTLGEEGTILDLACGPGCLGTRLSQRFPRARVIGLDFDPVLLALARAANAGDARRSWIETDLRAPKWLAPWTVELSGVDAVVSTTALHWLGSDELMRVYRDLAACIRPGGVFVNGDHVAPERGTELLANFASVHKQRAERLADAQGVPDWRRWWEEIAADPAYADLHRERARRFGERHGEEPLTLSFHLAALRQAGFAEAGVVWQRWDDVVMTGVKADTCS
ncbi:MAG TPA: class I SAM-dependent methyltransferase [Polyangiaceae bacterium]|nr:class I SAM-dependent methyltransferase [Polyangiaceae bacterium]